MIGLPKHPLSAVLIEHPSQQKWNVGKGTQIQSKTQPLHSINRKRRTNRSSKGSRNTKTLTTTTAKTRRSYSIGALLPSQGKPHDMPNLQQYTTPSMRTFINEVPTPYTLQTAESAARNRVEKNKREKYALRALSKQAGLGKTKVRFRSDRLSAEVALTQITSQWNNDSQENLQQQTRLSRQLQRQPEDSSSPQHQNNMPTPKQIEDCLQALESLPSHLATIIPTLRRAIYSDNYAGITPGSNDSTVLDAYPYYAVCTGLENSNRYLLDDIESLKMKLLTVEKDRNDIRTLLKKSNHKNHELREKVAAEEQKNSIIKKELSNMRDIASDYLEENNNMTQRYINLDQQHQTLFRENKETKTQLSDLREVYSSVSKELGHAIRTCGTLETQSKIYRKQIAEANRTVAEHANLKAQYEQMALEFENTKEELSELKDDIQRTANKKAAIALKKMGFRD